jgi:hypothetical protein
MTPSVEQVSEAYAKLLEQRGELDSKYLAEREALDEKADKLQEWLWHNSEHTATSLVEEFISFRDSRAELKKQYDINDARLKEYMEKRETKLLEMMQNIDAQSLKTPFGTAYIQIKTRYSCADWPAYWDYMKTNDRMDLLEKRPAQAALAKIQEDGKELPPGLNLYSERTVTVRRS